MELYDNFRARVIKIFQSDIFRVTLCTLICGMMLIPHGFGVFRWPQGDYGVGVLNDNISCGMSRSVFFVVFISGPLNILSSVLVYGADFVSHRVQIPSDWNKFLKPLRVLLMLSVIPSHLL